MSKCLIQLDDTTAVDFDRVIGLTSDKFDGQEVTRIYLEDRVDPFRVMMSLADVLEKFQTALEPLWPTTQKYSPSQQGYSLAGILAQDVEAIRARLKDIS